MEPLTVKGSQMQKHQRNRHNQNHHHHHPSNLSSSSSAIKDKNFKNDDMNPPSSMMGADYYPRRKTSAEIVSEARTHLLSATGNDEGGIGGGGGGGSVSISSSSSTTSSTSSTIGIGGGVGNINIGGARLISTRRPITPRDPGRQLYGKPAPPGRPPSAFSLRYLQNENRALPCLEPIQQQIQKINDIATPAIVPRSKSIDGTDNILSSISKDFATKNNNNNATLISINKRTPNNDNVTTIILQDNNSSVIHQNNRNNNHHSRLQGKLPALLSPLQITTSLDNLSEEMPPHPDSSRRKSESISTIHHILNSSNLIDNKIPFKEIEKNPENEDGRVANEEIDGEFTTAKYKSNSNKKHQNHQNHHYYPLMMRQTKSFDIPLQTTSMELSQLNEEDNDDDDDATAVCKDENKMKMDQQNGTEQNDNNDGKKRLARSNDLLAQSSTETLLDLLKAHSGIKECNDETVRHINAILVELYSRVKGAKGNWRGTILGGLYGLVECSSPQILLAVARVVLALCVTGSNLTGACKLIFKVAKNETNDYLFIDTDVPELLIDGLGRASPLEEPEACIYGYGAVRFLANAVQCSNNNTNSNSQINQRASSSSLSSNSMNRQKSLAQRLARHGAVQLMVLHLQILNESGAIKKLTGPPLHVLYQLSAALRALAGIPQIFSSNNLNSNNKMTSLSSSSLYSVDEVSSSSSGGCPIVIKETTDAEEIQLELACPHLVKAAEIAIGEFEIQSNLIRTLSILSENETCCECLAQFSARIAILLGPIDEIVKDVPEKPLTIFNRLGYILGNIVARCDDARIQLFENDVAMQYLLEVLNLYSKQNLTNRNQMGDTVVDVLIKLIRVIVNMSVNPEVGHGLACKSPLGRILLRILTSVNNNRFIKVTSELEELRVATLGALHNLCFYQDNNAEQEIPLDSLETDLSESIRDLLLELCILLSDTLKSATDIAKTEAARVLGNMTRNAIVRDIFCANGGLKAIVNCLDSANDDYELIATASGVLVNLLGDWERRAPFRELKGPLILRDILQKSTKQEDWLLAAIVCQALWNYLIDSGNIVRSLGEDEADCIAGQLAEYLDEDRLFKGQQPDVLWEQFATVAADLLEKIQTSISAGDSHYFYQSDDEEDNVNISGAVDDDDGSEEEN